MSSNGMNRYAALIRQMRDDKEWISPAHVAPLLDEREKLLKLIADIDASDFLEHSIRCTIHAHGDMANAVCSCGLNALQERINEAQA